MTGSSCIYILCLSIGGFAQQFINELRCISHKDQQGDLFATIQN